MRFLLSLICVSSLGLAAGASEVPIIPKPVSATVTEGTFTLAQDTVILTDRATRQVGEMLARLLAPATGWTLPVQRGKPKDNSVALAIDPGLARLGEEGYTLEVRPKRIIIRAPKPAGVFYGTQSFRQLLPPAIFASSVQKGVSWDVPCLKVEDHPRFVWRGALVDVGRHFMPKERLLKFIDLIAMQKINTLQLHLTDDQGWRIEIKKYPKLTEIGSKRKQTRLGHERQSKEFDGKPHGGFFTQQDIREIVAYARERFVNVVPEIEMPGHATAAIAAYPELGSTGKQLEVGTYWGVYKSIFNPSERTILFLQDVLGEVIELFPGRFIHVGGDEAPKDEWKASPQVQARIKELGLKDEAEMQSYFIRRMDQFLTSRGRRLIGWDEILEGGLAPGATVMSWRGTEGGIAAAKAGHDVVMTPTDYLYLDYYQSKDPQEPLAIGGFVPLEKVYAYEPVPAELTPEQGKRVLGAQGNLWTEYIRTTQHLEYMAFPRLAAVAEMTWTPKQSKDLASFKERLKAQEERWRALGVNFRPLGKR